MDRTDTSTSSTARANDAAFYGDSVTPGARPLLVTHGRLPSALLKGIAGWASQDPTRPHLNGVLVDGVFVIASDGHRLVRVPVLAPPKGQSAQFTIPLSTVIAACKAAGAAGTVEIQAHVCVTRPTGGILRAMPKSGDIVAIPWKASETAFAPYDKVIPAFDASPSVLDPITSTPLESVEAKARIVGHAVNVRYLAAMEGIVMGANPKGSGEIVLRRVSGPFDPIVYTAHVDVMLGKNQGIPTMITFVIMPMRADAEARYTKAIRAARGAVTANPCLSKAERKRLGL